GGADASHRGGRVPRVAEWVWSSTNPGARAARVGLMGPAAGFRAASLGRVVAYRRGWLPTRHFSLPSVSVGNLTVGGTGKTPIASWIAGFYAARGITPGILLRGYGADEGALHSQLLPGAVVVEDADRRRGAAVAQSRGAQILVLDDAFQHLRLARDLDIVL